MNPELGIPILDALWNHFSDYYVNDEEVLPPLQFDNIHLVKDPDIVLKVKKNTENLNCNCNKIDF